MPLPRFTGSFTQQRAIPEEAISAAVELMRTGRLHRYDVAEGEESQVMALEREFAAWQDTPYCLALASGGQAMQIALRAAGVEPGMPVLTNAFTLAPVPGAIAAVGGSAVLVEIDENLVIDLDDLARKAHASGARVLLLSNMRGHLCDMDRLEAVAAELGLTVIEDCAHTMGAAWNGRKSGNFGLAGCFSTQTYKHVNSGEGGLLTSRSAGFMAKAIVLSGSYMHYGRHGAAPPPEAFGDIRYDTPNMSARMDNLRAAILRPQIETLHPRIEQWNARYRRVADALRRSGRIRLPVRPDAERFVGSSIQFLIPGIGDAAAAALVAGLARAGVELKWFGAAEPAGFTSAHRSWRYLPRQELPRTDSVLAALFDMRLPLSFGADDCDLIAAHILAAVDDVTGAVPP